MNSIENKNEVPLQGLLPALANLGTDYRRHFVDILGNHFISNELTASTIDLSVEFEKINSSFKYKFSRCEENSTGLGMSRETLTQLFFGVPQKSDQGLKGHLGVHNLGEKLANIVLSKDVPQEEKGFTVVTKLKEDDEYLYGVFEPFNWKWIIKPHRLSHKKAMKEGLPVDRIGTNGTYSSYVINVESISDDNSWYDDLKEYTENIFMGYLDDKNGDPIYNLNFKLIQGGLTVDDIKLKSKIIAYQQPNGSSDYTQAPKKHSLALGKHSYDYTIGKRLMVGSDEMQEFDANPATAGRRALKANGLIEHLQRHAVVIIKDKHTGYIFNITKVPVSKASMLERLVFSIEVDKSDIITDALKSQALIKKMNGKALAITVLHREILGAARQIYQSENTISETDIRDQLASILKGDKYYDSLRYRALCNELSIPLADDGSLEESYEYCKENIQIEYPVHHKHLDIYFKNTGHILEVKIDELDGDKDLNQILAYGLITPNVKKVTTLAVSKPSMNPPKSITSDIPTLKVSKFSTDLNKCDETNHIQWNVVDLRYFELHTIKN